jgi:signal transduction histidine kinase
MNQFVLLLMRNLELDETSHRLDILFPELYKHLLAFKRGLDVPYRTKVEFSSKCGTQFFDLIVLKSCGLLCRYVLILNPVCEMSKELDEKLAWADLARRLSHHVRRHIANILLALGPLEKDLKEESTNREYLDLLKTEINQIKVFTHSFQRFTELRDYQLKAQDLIPSLEHILSRITIPKDVMLERDWSLKSIHAYIEPIRFEEALTNLITNALDAMPDGGTIQISVRDFPLHEVNHEGRSVLIEIEDTGCGIPEKYREEIWQPFFTTKQSGTGIGLPESRKIIESMHGTIEFQSEVGVGTIVSIWLKGTENG